jgi:succinate dehydrogenase / fumarate reductase cytochrome b subunit
MRFPVTAWVSILHRLSGAFIFLLIPAVLWVLQESLASEERLMILQKTLHHPAWRVLIWLIFSAVVYHSAAGIRHLGMDLHCGDSKKAARLSAWVVLSLAFSIILWGAYKLW